MDNTSKLENQDMQFDQEIIDRTIEAIQNLAEFIVDVWQKTVQVITSVLNDFWEALRGFLQQVNPKIYNLAYHHKKHRVRKKNQKRLFILFRRWLNV